jgi:heat shock protein HtpX
MPVHRSTFYEVQSRNRTRTAVLLLTFVALFGITGLGADWYFLGFRPGDLLRDDRLSFPVFTFVALVVATGLAVNGYWNGAREVLFSTRARRADPTRPEHKQLLNVVEEMSIASGLPMPGVYVVPDQDPNAYAVGRDPAHASIAVTEGLLATLNREEMQAVVAHELSHVRNLDIRTMTLVAALYGGLVLISDWASHGFRFGGGVAHGRGRDDGDRRGGGSAIFLLLFLALIVVAPLLGRLLALSVSRAREFDADATSAEMTRNPAALAAALRKIEGAIAPTRSIGRGSAHLCIVDPRGAADLRRQTVYGGLFETHPPVRERIALLEGMAGVDASRVAPSAGSTPPAAA